MNRDEIFIFDKQGNEKGTIRFPEKSGPRHGVFSADGKHLFVAGELSNRLYSLNADDFSFEDETALGKDGSPAAVRICDDLIQVSIRESNVICSVEFRNGKLICRDMCSCGGKHPRDMIIADGCNICANLDSSSVTCIKNGILTSEIRIPQAVSLCVTE